MGSKKRAVVVLSTPHYIFFGWTADSFIEPVIHLERARNCAYYTPSTKGIGGLAASGPDALCRIGPEIPLVALHGVTCVLLATDKAVKAWETAQWKV